MKAEYFTEEGGEMRAAMAADRDGRNRAKGADGTGPDWREHRIRPDMRLLVRDARAGSEPLRFEYDSAAPPLQFFYCLEGEAQIRIRRASGRVESRSTSRSRRSSRRACWRSTRCS